MWLSLSKDSLSDSRFVVGIDATNLLRGGGLNHLSEILSSVEPGKLGIDRVIVWSRVSVLSKLPSEPWLVKRSYPILERGSIFRALWQRIVLPRLVRKEGVGVLFAPGGRVYKHEYPIVTMSQNLLPFDSSECARYGFSFTRLRLLLLHNIQGRAFKNANATIFLTDYARDLISSIFEIASCSAIVIPHGINSRFFIAPRKQNRMYAGPTAAVIRVVYVSTIDLYKHQWHVVRAIYALRQRGFNVELDLVGPSYPPADIKLQKAIRECGGAEQWVFMHGSLPYEKVHLMYGQADIGLFASSCENMPLILLEMMAAGIPIACSDRGPMPEVLGAAGVYFDPENSSAIMEALLMLIEDTALRERLANLSYREARDYSWSVCANETFQLLVDVGRRIDEDNAIPCVGSVDTT